MEHDSTATPSTIDKLVITLSCPDQPGIVHAASGIMSDIGGNIIQSQQFGDPDTGLFFMRMEAESPVGRGPVEEGLTRIADKFNATWRVDQLGRPLRTVIMVSREGHCLTDLLYRQRSQGLPIEVVAVVGNHPDLAPVAQFYGVPFLSIPVTKDSKARAEAELLDLIKSEQVELVVLARYMQILSDSVCREMAGRVINIHHSFLPSFKGARPYAQAHERGVKLSAQPRTTLQPTWTKGRSSSRTSRESRTPIPPATWWSWGRMLNAESSRRQCVGMPNAVS